jgi:hypothetical protein
VTHSAYTHEFVEFIPEELDDAVLYVSLEFGTTAHLCMCGCRTKVVAPLAPTGWQAIFDGESVSLKPSIGNWSFPCQSHYWLRDGRVAWAAKWSRAEIDAGRKLDARRTGQALDRAPVEADADQSDEPAGARRGIAGRLRRAFRKR